jgi:hypothetical protein
MGQSEQAILIHELNEKGYTNTKIASLFGLDPSFIRQASKSEEKIGRGGKISKGKGQNLIPALKQLVGGGKISPSILPERRKTKSGQAAKVRKSRVVTKTVGGKERTITTVKNGPATLRKSITDAAKKGQHVKWTIGGTIRTKSKQVKQGYVTDSTPGGWTGKALLDRIDNPQSGDGWRAGDVIGALKEISIASQGGAVTSITKITGVTLWTE